MRYVILFVFVIALALIGQVHAADTTDAPHGLDDRHLVPADDNSAAHARAVVPRELGPGPFFLRLSDLPGGDYHSEALSVSDDGRVVVGHSDEDAFRWTTSTGMVRFPPGENLVDKPTVLAVSGDGTFVFGWVGDGFPWADPFRWSEASGMGYFGCPPGMAACVPYDASHNGSVAVGKVSPAGAFVSDCLAFRWTVDDGYEILETLPTYDPTRVGPPSTEARAVSADGSVVVGVGASYPEYEAFRWTPDERMEGLGFLPGHDRSMAHDVSADGLVIVGYSGSGGWYEAFRWTADGMKGLGDLPGGDFDSLAYGVDGDGKTVVGCSVTDAGQEAFLWIDDEMYNLKEFLVSELGLNLNGWILTVARDVSADGKFILGHGINPNGDTEAWLAYIGEEWYHDWPFSGPRPSGPKGMRNIPEP